jgi:hypothetical protein
MYLIDNLFRVEAATPAFSGEREFRERAANRSPAREGYSMAINLRWVCSASASCFHAVDALASGAALADAGLAAALAGSTNWIVQAVEARAPARQFFRHLVPLAAGIENNRELAKVALAKACGQAAADSAERLAGLLGGAEQAFLRAVPGVVDELALRAEPLRLHWEARGPGLLSGIANRTEADLVVESADVVLVHPALGGGGAAHLPYNSVRIEAVLANPLPELPEVLRLGWLLAQLNADLPRFQGELHRDRLAIVAPLAMLPPALAAGADVELCHCDAATLAAAIQAWRLEGGESTKLADAAWTWWETYQDSRPPWGVALAALDRMLAA